MTTPANQKGWTGRLMRVAQHLGNRGWMLAGSLYRIGERTLSDGFIHAGNLAYLSLVTLFPAAILIHATMASLGRTEAGSQAIDQFLRTLPAEVAALVEPVLDEVVMARSGTALAAGALIALWTTSGFVGTLSDMLRRAHDAPSERPFWEQRLLAVLVTLGATAVILFAFIGRHILELIASTLSPYVLARLPLVKELTEMSDLTRVTGMVAVFLSLWALFRVLTPRSVMRKGTPVWPGPLLVTVVWVGTTALLGPIMANAANFSLTYGAFTGVMLAMLFFYIVGLAMVAGVETNATLASWREVAEMVVRWRRFAAGFRRPASGTAD